MNATQRALAAYGQAAQTLPPLQQIVLLYDGAIRRIKEARSAVAQQRVDQRYIATAKATAIIEGLQSCLDLERGGEIAHNLDRIYTYIVLRLQSINLGSDVAVCDELIARLDELRGAWAELCARGDAGPVPRATAPDAPLALRT